MVGFLEFYKIKKICYNTNRYSINFNNVNKFYNNIQKNIAKYNKIYQKVLIFKNNSSIICNTDKKEKKSLSFDVLLSQSVKLNECFP